MKVFEERTRRIVFAFAVGPLAIVPAMLLLLSIQYLLKLPHSNTSFFNALAGGFLISIVGLVFSYGFTLFYGIPVFFILQKFNRQGIIAVCVASVIPTIVAIAILSFKLPAVLAMAYFSLVVGVACWYIANRSLESSD